MNIDYDVVILGSGIGGSTLAMGLARQGLKVLITEKGRHPRFAIGESTIPATNVGWELLADHYNIPEYRKICHYLKLREIGVAGYPKAHFWFGVHRKGEELNPHHELMAETLNLPLGPDVHFMRSELDAWLVSRLPAYNVDIWQETTLNDFEYDQTNKSARLSLDKNGSAVHVRARYVVDASGHAAILARKFDLLDDPKQLHTNTRAIYGHFRNIKFIDDIMGHNKAYRFKRDGGTVHHCFEGGWLWVIRFDNGICSVGLMLDRDKYPLDKSISPEDELESFIQRFPTVASQMSERELVSKLHRTDRVQFLSKKMVGDGFILMPHASSFVEPLFSTGITFTVAFIARFLPRIRAAFKEQDFSPERFKDMEKAFAREVRMIDKIVSGHIRAFSHYEVYKQFARVWNAAQGFQLIGHMFGNHSNPMGLNQIWGSASEKWRDTISELHKVVTDNSLPDKEKAQKLKEISDRVPDPFDVPDYGIGIQKACNVTISVPNRGYFEFAREILFNTPEVKEDVNWQNFVHFGSRVSMKLLEMRSKYAMSKLSKGKYARELDHMHRLTNSPDYPGYKDFFAPFNDIWNSRYLKVGAK